MNTTTEQKQELIDTLKGPRYYRVHLWGYGGEAAYININKEAYEFWKPITDDEGDSNLVEYMVNAEGGDLDDLEVVVPPEAMFMQEETDGEVYAYPWYEAPGEFCHQHGVDFSNARISIEEVDSGEYMSKHVADVIDGEDLSELLDKVEEESNYEIEPKDWGECDTFGEEGEYVLQFYSSEKGSFFDGIIETVGEFDIKKLKAVINEYPNGEDIVDGLLYDGVDIDNQGGDTNGKGYSAYLWKN